jgi:hypothetical protein
LSDNHSNSFQVAVRVADHPFVAEFFASQKPLPAEYKQIAPFVDAGHSYRSSLVPKPA